jgi:cholinesterase
MRSNALVGCLIFITAVAGLSSGSHHWPPPPYEAASPQVKVRNGTLQGHSLPAFNEDVFLGIPFAAPPVGDLRLRHPLPYPDAWDGVRDATARSPSCPGYAGFDIGLALGEGW